MRSRANFSLHKCALKISLKFNFRDSFSYLQSEIATANLPNIHSEESNLDTTMSTQIERAQKQFEQAKARLQKAQSRENEKRRKKETRAKILLGGWMIAQAKKDPRAAERMKEIIATFSERDQACFDGLDLLKQESGNE